MKKERIQMKKERANVRKERTRRRVLDLMNNPPRNRSGQGRDNRENELLRGVLGIMQYHR